MNKELAIFGILGLKIGFATSAILWGLVTAFAITVTATLILKVVLVIAVLVFLKELFYNSIVGGENYHKKYKEFIE